MIKNTLNFNSKFTNTSRINSKLTGEFIKIIEKNKIGLYDFTNKIPNSNVSLFLNALEKYSQSNTLRSSWIAIKRKTRKSYSRFISRDFYERKFNRSVQKDYFLILNSLSRKNFKFNLSFLKIKNTDYSWLRIPQLKKRSSRLQTRRILSLYYYKMLLTFFCYSKHLAQNKYLNLKNLKMLSKYNYMNYFKKRLNSTKIKKNALIGKDFYGISECSKVGSVITNDQSISDVSLKIENKKNWVLNFILELEIIKATKKSKKLDITTTI